MQSNSNCILDSEGLVCQHFEPERTKVNRDYCILQCYKGLLLSCLAKCPHLKATWMLHQDNVRPHTLQATTDFMSKNRMETIRHPPYSPNLASCDVWLVPDFKQVFCGKQFESQEALENKKQEFFKSIPMEKLQITIH